MTNTTYSLNTYRLPADYVPNSDLPPSANQYLIADLPSTTKANDVYRYRMTAWTNRERHFISVYQVELTIKERKLTKVRILATETQTLLSPNGYYEKSLWPFVRASLNDLSTDYYHDDDNQAHPLFPKASLVELDLETMTAKLPDRTGDNRLTMLIDPVYYNPMGLRKDIDDQWYFYYAGRLISLDSTIQEPGLELDGLNLEAEAKTSLQREEITVQADSFTYVSDYLTVTANPAKTEFEKHSVEIDPDLVAISSIGWLQSAGILPELGIKVKPSYYDWSFSN